MFSNWFLKPLPEDFFQGVNDMHSHLLPAVDDGFASEEDAFEALRYLEKIGFRKMRLTPHLMATYPENDRDSITAKFEAFREKAKTVTGIELHLAAEHMVDDHFEDHFKRGFLTLNNGNLVLCETSYIMPPPGLSDSLFEIMQGGYQPVVAHPERYRYASLGKYQRWKDRDYLFQLNLLSLSGAYGQDAKEKSLYLLDNGMYDFVGTDMHHLSSFKKFVPTIKLKTKQIDMLRALFEKNATLFE